MRIDTETQILVVDDDMDFRVAMKDLLIRRGYQVETAYDSLCALEMMRGKNYDVLITDLGMPGMDGWDLILKVRESYKNLQFLIVTGSESPENLERVKSLGVYGYFVKPLNIAKFDRCLREIVRARSAG